MFQAGLKNQSDFSQNNISIWIYAITSRHMVNRNRSPNIHLITMLKKLSYEYENGKLGLRRSYNRIVFMALSHGFLKASSTLQGTVNFLLYDAHSWAKMYQIVNRKQVLGPLF